MASGAGLLELWAVGVAFQLDGFMRALVFSRPSGGLRGNGKCPLPGIARALALRGLQSWQGGVP